MPVFGVKVVDGAAWYFWFVSSMFELTLFAVAADAVTAVNGVTVIIIISDIRHAMVFLNESIDYSSHIYNIVFTLLLF